MVRNKFIVEASFVEEMALRPKIKIEVRTIDDMLKIAKLHREMIVRCRSERTKTVAYYIILPDKYFVHHASS